jgi:hypothetical protein
LTPGADPTIVVYYGSVVKIYIATNGTARIWNKTYFPLITTTPALLRCICKVGSRMYNATSSLVRFEKIFNLNFLKRSSLQQHRRFVNSDRELQRHRFKQYIQRLEYPT